MYFCSKDRRAAQGRELTTSNTCDGWIHYLSYLKSHSYWKRGRQNRGWKKVLLTFKRIIFRNSVYFYFLHLKGFIAQLRVLPAFAGDPGSIPGWEEDHLRRNNHSSILAWIPRYRGVKAALIRASMTSNYIHIQWKISDFNKPPWNCGAGRLKSWN